VGQSFKGARGMYAYKLPRSPDLAALHFEDAKNKACRRKAMAPDRSPTCAWTLNERQGGAIVEILRSVLGAAGKPKR